MDLSLIFIVISVCVYIVSYGMAYGPIIYVYLADTLPDIGIGLIVSIIFLDHTVVSYAFPLIKESLGVVNTFLIFAVASILALIFMIKYIKETKGKSMKQIWLEYAIGKDEI